MYYSMVKNARDEGIADENAMWSEIKNVDKLLEKVKESHPDLYWKHLRKAHESIYGKHYDEQFARYDVSNLHYTDRNGITRHGEHWTPEEVVLATQSKVHPSDVTEWDKYVAYNAMYADLCKGFEDEDILKAGHLFFFNDEDWRDGGSSIKIWEYMNH